MPDKFDQIDWSVTTWEGNRKEQIRRWSRLTFDQILHAQEEMAELARELSPSGMKAGDRGESRSPGPPAT